MKRFAFVLSHCSVGDNEIPIEGTRIDIDFSRQNEKFLKCNRDEKKNKKRNKLEDEIVSVWSRFEEAKL